MKSRRIARLVLYGILFLLPWHAIWIFRSVPLVGSAGKLEGAWQYGVIGAQPLDILIVFFAALLCTGGIFIQFKKHSKHKWDTIFCVALIAISFLSIAWSPDKALALFRAVRVLEGIVLYAGMRFLQPSLSSIAWCFAIGGALQGALGLYQYVQQTVFASTFLGTAFHSAQTLGDAVIENRDIRVLRAYGIFPHPNLYGAYLACAWLWCLYLVGILERRSTQIISIFLLHIITTGLLLSFSRGALIGLACSLVAWGVLGIMAQRTPQRRVSTDRQRIAPRAMALVLVAMTAGILTFAVWEPLSVRLGIAGWQRLEERSITERTHLLQSAFLQLPETMLLGVGIGQATNASALREKNSKVSHSAYEYQPVHALALLVLTEIGVVGFASFFGVAALRLWATRRRSFTAALLIFLGVSALFDHGYWTDSSGIVVWWSLLAVSDIPDTSSHGGDMTAGS